MQVIRLPRAIMRYIIQISNPSALRDIDDELETNNLFELWNLRASMAQPRPQ